MNPKSATALLGVAILVGGEIALEKSDSLVPREHVHTEMRTELIATTAAPVSVSGARGIFDNEAFSPAFDVARASGAGVDSSLVAAQLILRNTK